MKWTHSVIALLGAAATIYSPQIKHAIATQPDLAAAVIGVYAILAHIAPSPIGRGDDEPSSGV